MTTVHQVSSFSPDINRICEFYRDLFGFEEGDSSPIYRSVWAKNVKIGFHALSAYDLLEIPELANPTGIRQLITFDGASREDVDEKTERAVALGARIAKPQYVSYYNQYQVVLLDPDDNLFRITFDPA